MHSPADGISTDLNATPDSNYSMFANGGDLIQDMDAITVSASNLTVAVSFDELNTQVLDWDKTTANSSTIKTFGASGSGADYEILSDSTVYAVALAANATTAAGYVWIATDSGLDYVDLSDDSVLTLTTTYGKIINDAVDSLCVISSITYGVTTALSAAGGAGFAAMSDIGAPADTNLVVRGFNNDDLLVGFEVPTESDRDHAKLYARKNGGQWNYLLTTGVLATSGTAFEFDTTGYEAFLTCQLKDLANGKYEVKVTQFDTIGNESTGTTETEYLDEPNATILVNGGSAQTRTRAVLLDLSGDSGDDSLAEANQIYEWKVKEDSQAWSAAIIYRNPSMGTAQTVPFYIPGAAGLKTLQVKGYDRAGNESAIDSTTTTFFSPYEGNTTTFNHDDVIHIAWELGSDSATLGSYSDYDAATYPVANLQDPRLAKVWRGSVTKTVQCMAQFDLGTSPGQTDIFYMKNHDLAYYDDNGAKIKIYLCAHATNLGTPTSWLTNATYKVELTNLIHMHSICHRPEVTYQQWAVIVEVGSLVFLGTATPYFGRMILAQTAGIWKPTNSNFDNDIRLTLNDNSIVNESEDQTLEAVERDKQLIADLSFENMTEADTQSFRQVYSELGHSHDCLVLLRPSDFDTGTTEPSAWDGTNYIMPPLYSQIADVGDFRHVANGRWNFDVEFREIIGGRSPYGMRTSD